MISKPVLIGGAIALGALLLYGTSGTAHAAQLPPRPIPPAPEPPTLPPYIPQAPDPTPGVVTIPEVVVQGDPAAIQFLQPTIDAGIRAAAAVQQGGGAGCTVSPSVRAFQIAYNLDPTSQHPENMLGPSFAITYSLGEDGKFGLNTATALWYVTGIQMAGLCGQGIQ